MSKIGLKIGDRVRVGLHGSNRWFGKVVEIKKGSKRGDYLFLIERDFPQGDMCVVIDKYVRKQVEA
jgi:hypothetical protein